MKMDEQLQKFGFTNPVPKKEDRFVIITTTCYVVRDIENKMDINRYIDLDGTAYQKAVDRKNKCIKQQEEFDAAHNIIIEPKK
jgi:hypothetical protein